MALAGFDDAPVYNRLPQFDEGSYVAEAIRMERFASNDEPNNFRFKTEFRILQASPGSKLNVGDEVAEVVPLFGPFRKTFYSKVKALLGALSDEDPRTIKESDLDEAVADDQPFVGQKVKVYVTMTPKKGKPNELYPRTAYSTFKVNDTTSTAAPA